MVTRIRPISYQVLVTPLVSKAVYGTEIEVTADIEIDDYVKQNGISTIKREIDNGDFDIGVFVFDSINVTCLNMDGRFNDESDPRSIFKYKRDRAKFKINFFDGTSNTPAVTFRGLLDERASRADFKKQEVKFKILSRDSIINRTKVAGGIITNGQSASQAIKNILNQTDITAVLNYNESDINVQYDFTIDDGTYFEGKTSKEALDVLLVATNSVLTVDSTDTMIVRSREVSSGRIYNFYGDGDLQGRENVIDITNYNTGVHRAFNTIVDRSGLSVTDRGYVETNGDVKKTVDLSFVTVDETKLDIMNNILDNWKVPKIELELTCRTCDAQNINFFDLIALDVPFAYKPYGNSRLPLYGSARYGTAVYPYARGAAKISPKWAFKVVGFTENPKDFTTTLRLRQRGITISDGVFASFITVYGSAVYGKSEYQEDIYREDPNRHSVYGAGKYGTVIYGG